MFPDSYDTRRSSSPIRGSVSNASPLNSPPRRFSSPHQSSSSASAIQYSDRYIPSRTGSSLENSFDLMTKGSKRNTPYDDNLHNHSASENNSARIMNSLIRAELLGQSGGDIEGLSNPNKILRSRGDSARASPNVLRYRSSEVESSSSRYPQSAHSSPGASFRALSTSSRLSLTEAKKPRRKISRVPYKVLDAPALQDDFYLNLIDWSASNVLAVGLGSSVYMWSAYTSKVTKLHDFGEIDNDSVTSVVWMGGAHLVVGMNSGSIQVWDTSQAKCIRKMEGHTARVGTLAWSPQSSILASGSRDRKILLHDVKIKGNFESKGSSPFYSPYKSHSSPFSSRRHSLPVPIYSSRESKIDNVFEARAGLGIPTPPLSPGITMGHVEDVSSAGRDSPPLHEQVFHGVRTSGSHEKTSWSIFDPDNEDDTNAGSVPPAIRRSDPGVCSFSSEKEAKPLPTSVGSNFRSCSSHDVVGNDSTMDVSDDEADDSLPSKICDPDGIYAGGSLLFSPRAPSPPPIPLHRSTLFGHSTPIRSGARASYPSTSPHSTTSAPCRIRELLAHKQEVCGLKWSFDEKQLASGGNDNKLLVWNVSATGSESKHSLGVGQAIAPEFKFCDHTAAVKAIAWSPHQTGLLASGGGTADRTIRFWNTSTGNALHHVDTGSQVCNLMWSTHINEIVSTHGYSLNQIAIWRYPCMQKIATLTGHTYRVLYLAMSPDGQSIVTGAGDETLRFWNVFPGPKLSFGSGLGSTVLFPSGGDIR